MTTTATTTAAVTTASLGIPSAGAPAVGDAIRDQVRAFVRDTFLFGDAGHPLGDHESLIEAGIVDSTGVLELVAFVEETFGLAVADAEIVPANFDSIARIGGYVADRRSRAAAA